MENCREKSAKINMYPLHRVRVMVLNATFKIVQLYRGCQLYWWSKPEFPEKIDEIDQDK